MLNGPRDRSLECRVVWTATHLVDGIGESVVLAALRTSPRVVHSKHRLLGAKAGPGARSTRTAAAPFVMRTTAAEWIEALILLARPAAPRAVVVGINLDPAEVLGDAIDRQQCAVVVADTGHGLAGEWDRRAFRVGRVVIATGEAAVLVAVP